MRTYRFAVVVEKDENGYFAYCPDLQGCYTQGETWEKVLENIKDSIRLHVEDRLAMGEELITPELISVSSIEVTVCTNGCHE